MVVEPSSSGLRSGVRGRGFLFAFSTGTLLVAFLACSGSDTGAGAGGTCDSWYEAITTSAQSCDRPPTSGTRSDFVAFCTALANAPGSNVTIGVLSDCGTAVNVQCSGTCNLPPGNLADGSACSEGLQCASGRCTASWGSNGPRCGICAKVAKEGEACGSGPPNSLPCGPGLRCWQYACVKDVVIPSGGACSGGGPEGEHCAPGTICIQTSSATGVCAPPPKKGEACKGRCDTNLWCSPDGAGGGTCADKVDLGAPCTGIDPISECKGNSHLVYCDTAGSHTCSLKKVARAGEACGTLSVTCDVGLLCPTSGSASSTCIARKKNGEACAPTDWCDDYLVCFGGKCVVSDPALCK